MKKLTLILSFVFFFNLFPITSVMAFDVTKHEAYQNFSKAKSLADCETYLGFALGICKAMNGGKDCIKAVKRRAERCRRQFVKKRRRRRRRTKAVKASKNPPIKVQKPAVKELPAFRIRITRQKRTPIQADPPDPQRNEALKKLQQAKGAVACLLYGTQAVRACENADEPKKCRQKIDKVMMLPHCQLGVATVQRARPPDFTPWWAWVLIALLTTLIGLICFGIWLSLAKWKEVRHYMNLYAESASFLNEEIDDLKKIAEGMGSKGASSTQIVERLGGEQALVAIARGLAGKTPTPNPLDAVPRVPRALLGNQPPPPPPLPTPTPGQKK